MYVFIIALPPAVQVYSALMDIQYDDATLIISVILAVQLLFRSPKAL